MTPEELSTARKDLLQQLDAILHDAGFPSPDGTLGEDLPERLRRVVARAKFSELAESMGPPPVSLLAGAPRGPTGEKVETLGRYTEGSEQASLAEYVRNACSYLSELPVLVRKKRYSEIMHHAGHVIHEMEEARIYIRILGDRERAR